jgi:hypothetical protein
MTISSRKKRPVQSLVSPKLTKIISEQISKLPKIAKEYAASRDKRDDALKLAAAALGRLELAVDTARSQTKIDRLEGNYEHLVNTFVEMEAIAQARVDDLEKITSAVKKALKENARRPSASTKREAGALNANRRTSSKGRSRPRTSVPSQGIARDLTGTARGVAAKRFGSLSGQSADGDHEETAS